MSKEKKITLEFTESELVTLEIALDDSRTVYRNSVMKARTTDVIFAPMVESWERQIENLEKLLEKVEQAKKEQS